MNPNDATYYVVQTLESCSAWWVSYYPPARPVLETIVRAESSWDAALASADGAARFAALGLYDPPAAYRVAAVLLQRAGYRGTGRACDDATRAARNLLADGSAGHAYERPHRRRCSHCEMIRTFAQSVSSQENPFHYKSFADAYVGLSTRPTPRVNRHTMRRWRRADAAVRRLVAAHEMPKAAWIVRRLAEVAEATK